MPEIGTYPLFDGLVDADSFLGLSSVNGGTYRGTVAQLRQKLVTDNTATSEDVSTSTNLSRLMTLERAQQLSEFYYVLPRRAAIQTVNTPVSNVIVNMTSRLSIFDDLWINFRNFRFDYASVAAATIQLDISYDGGATYPTNNHAYQATVTVANAMTHGGGVNTPVVLLPSISIGNPVLLNMGVRVFGQGDASDLRTYDWRGSVRYFNTTTRVGPFWGSYTTTGNQPLPTHLRLSSTGGQNITSGTITIYRSRGFF